MAAWGRARAAWQAGPQTPVAVGFFSYDLGRQLERPRRPPGSAAAQPSAWPGWSFVSTTPSTSGIRPPGAERSGPRTRRPARALLDELSRPAAGPSRADPHGFALDPLQPLEPPERHLQAVASACRSTCTPATSTR